MEIDLDMTSLSENYLKVVLNYSNLPPTVSISSTSLFMPYNTSGDLAHGETKTYKIYIRNTGSSSLSLSDINLQVSFDNSFGASLLKADTVNQYWYVEMGTIATDMGSEYIRWRYISADGENPYTYSTSAPTGIGYFLLETDITRNYRENSVFVCPINAVPFNSDSNCISWDDDLKHNLNGWTNIPANDYSASIIRRYINGEDVNIDVEGEYDGIMLPSGDKSNMYIDLNIDIENDLVFQNIIGRTLGDLYSDMYASASGGAVEFPTFYEDADIIYTENDIDKFWLLSYKEISNLLNPNIEDWYWDWALRSPGIASQYQITYPYLSDSEIYTGDLEAYYSARAAFKMAI